MDRITMKRKQLELESSFLGFCYQTRSLFFRGLTSSGIHYDLTTALRVAAGVRDYRDISDLGPKKFASTSSLARDASRYDLTQFGIVAGTKQDGAITLLLSPQYTSHFLIFNTPLPPHPPLSLPCLLIGELFECKLVGEAGEEALRFGHTYRSLATRPPLPIFAGQLQIDGHQHPSRAFHPSSPHLLCLSDYSSLLLGRSLRQCLANGLEQSAGEPAPAPPRILFLILA